MVCTQMATMQWKLAASRKQILENQEFWNKSPSFYTKSTANESMQHSWIRSHLLTWEVSKNFKPTMFFVTILQDEKKRLSLNGEPPQSRYQRMKPVCWSLSVGFLKSISFFHWTYLMHVFATTLTQSMPGCLFSMKWRRTMLCYSIPMCWQ